MKPIEKATATASVTGILVFGVVFLIDYLHMLAHQPPHQPGEPWPPDVTSAPPSIAWILALPCGVGAFVVVFFVALVLFSSRRHETDSA